MKIETSNSFLEYTDNIVYVRLKEGSEITVESMIEQYNAQKQMVGNDLYCVLVDASSNTIVESESRTFMANHNPPNRKATAIVTKMNLATRVMANFYLKMSKPKVITKLFANEEGAIDWLKDILKKSASKN